MRPVGNPQRRHVVLIYLTSADRFTLLRSIDLHYYCWSTHG
jgi:hypothetical protein